MLYQDRALDEEGNLPMRCYFTSGRKLFQEWLIDMYCKMETNRLGFFRRNQAHIRADMYQGVQDAIAAGDMVRGGDVGRRIILPSTFIGGHRHMVQLYQDAMAIVRKHGKPDMFVTFTCNPNWPEIKAELLPSQSANDRPDIVSRVFRMKFRELMDDLVKKGIFGKVVADVHTIEWQKRYDIYVLCFVWPPLLTFFV